MNVGLGSKATNSTLIHITNGTRVNLEQTANSGTVTDGIVLGTSLQRGYNAVKLGDVSTNTVMAYASGAFNPYLYGTVVSVDAKNPSSLASQANIDMVSKNGVVFWASDGGEIGQGYKTNTTTGKIEADTAKTTRAGAYNSIIAFADGKITNTASPAYPNASTVKMKGNITAADKLYRSIRS